MNRAIPLAAPHTHSGSSTTQLMYVVLMALSPAAAYGVWLFGLPALMVMLSCCVSACCAELLCLKLSSKDWRSSFDGSALLTGILLAMSLPPATPWWIAAAGSVFAIAIGKQVFGGLGHNPFNPAMLGRVMLLICFPVELTDWRGISPPWKGEDGLEFSTSWLGVDGISSATPLSQLDQSHDLLALISGQHAGSLGETSAILIALGGGFLIFRGIIRPTIPMALLIGLAIPAGISHWLAPEQFASIGVHLFSGAAMLGAFFIATDMVSSPTSNKGQWVFGLGCGLLIWLIRCFGSYPEGVAFAVLIMNAATPVIDHYLRPTIFGNSRKFGQ